MTKILENEAREKGKSEGIILGKNEGIVSSIKNAMKNAGLSLDGAMDLLGVAAEDREMYAKLVNV